MKKPALGGLGMLFGGLLEAIIASPHCQQGEAMEWSAAITEFINAMPAWNSPGWNAIAAIGGSASAIAAFIALRANSRDRASERISKHCVTTLERAFTALVGQGEHPSSPLLDRLAWLTSARLIDEYKSSKRRLRDKGLRSELESHEEHWRRQFFLVLEPLATGHLGTFQSAEIDKTSAIIVHNFADWPNGKKDPLDAYGNYRKALIRLPLSKRWLSLRSYVGDLN